MARFVDAECRTETALGRGWAVFTCKTRKTFFKCLTNVSVVFYTNVATCKH